MVTNLRADALAISCAWAGELDGELRSREADLLRSLDVGDGSVDVVALGKSARPMAQVATALWGERVSRHLVVTTSAGWTASRGHPSELVGDHPVPGALSRRAGVALLEFLDAPTESTSTLFLVSGGASSLCVVPQDPLTLEDLAAVWAAALAAGLDITALNRIRAATSAISGGAVLRRVRTASASALILVDNVVSGAPWVASGLTFEVRPTPDEVGEMVDQLGTIDAGVRARLLEAADRRAVLMEAPGVTSDNRVLADPSVLVEHAAREARRRGYRVLEMGSSVHGDVDDVAATWMDALRRARDEGLPACLVGAGEVTVRVSGSGTGGRCQELAWRLARRLPDLVWRAVFVARASDGRDFVPGVAGAWVDASTAAHAASRGFDWERVAADNDTNRPLAALGQTVTGGASGWNLCDLYVALTAPESSSDPLVLRTTFRGSLPWRIRSIWARRRRAIRGRIAEVAPPT